MTKIVVMDGQGLNPGDLSWEPLKELGDVTIYDRTPEDKILERGADADIIITNKTPIFEESLRNLPKLKYVGVLATGYNNVDIELAKELGIVVTNIPSYSTDSVAQMVFAFILEFCHRVADHTDAVMRGDWSNSIDFTFWNYPLMELKGKTLGIIGFGTIGQRVADIATVFGMEVLAHSRTLTDQSARENFKWAKDMDEVFENSDFLSLHCPLTEETEGLVNMDNLKKMKDTAILINTSRGPVLVEDDLAKALNEDIIAGAGLDVLSLEPPQADNPLFKAKNCFITPHIAWATMEARQRLMNIATSNVKAFISGEPINVVNK